jgi:Xylanase inhibitor N-terminal
MKTKIKIRGAAGRKREKMNIFYLTVPSAVVWLSVVAADLVHHAHLRGPAQSTYTITSLENATVHLPLYAVSGTHHINAWIGQPPQKQALIVDTGSRLTATACDPCRQCGAATSRANPHFEPKKSTTFHSIACGQCTLVDQRKNDVCTKDRQCKVSQRYTEGSSWTAVEVNDMVFLGGQETETLEGYIPTTIAFTFGCQRNMQGLFRTQYANGILGLERSEHSFIGQLVTEQAIPRNAFSLCLTPKGGWLGLGGPLAHFHKTDMKFVPFTFNSGWYGVEVVQFYVGSECLACGVHLQLLRAFAEGKGTILDTGTTDTYLPKAIRNRLAALWEQLTNRRWESGTMQQYTFDEFQRLPTLFAQLSNNATIEIKPQNYMEGLPSEPWSGRRLLSNRVYADEPLGAVLGMNALVGYDLLFDVQDNRLGIAPADCERNDSFVSIY